MYLNIHNENYGYSVATFGDYVAVGNPAILRYDINYPTRSWTGSVDVFKYNYAVDQHDYIATLYKSDFVHDVILAAETGSLPLPSESSSIRADLLTELYGDDYTSDKTLLIDRALYTFMAEDGYGVSLDIKSKILVVGCPYYLQLVETDPGFSSSISGSCVDVFNLEKYETDRFNTPIYFEIPINFTFNGTDFQFSASNLPSGYDYADIVFATNANGPYDTRIARSTISSNGGDFTYAIPSATMLTYSDGFFKLKLFIDSNPYIMTIPNPDPPTGSFGWSVSINDNWLAVGSPYVSGSEGMVYIYKNDSIGTDYNWTFQQKITPITPLKGLMFGSCLELNKVTGSNSGSLIVGIGNKSGSCAFLFEYISGSWTQTFVFNPQVSQYPLQFGQYLPYSDTYQSASGYGNTVSIYNNTVVIGAPYERIVEEYSSSFQYQQGAVYVYEKCIGVIPTLWALVYKTFGDETTLKNNRFGNSVSIYGNDIAAGCIKIDDLDPCDIQATIEQLHYCNPDLENTLNGQVAFLLRNTSSNEWELAKVYQKKKRYLSPYRSFGWSVDVGDKSMVVGAPMYLSGSTIRQVGISTTQSFEVSLDDITGKAYIYNLKNYRPQFHVGNVFYRNGKVLLMTSGSIFDSILFNPISPYFYEYQMDFKGEHTIYEKQIICPVTPGEFNVSTNPTAVVLENSILDINGNGIFDFQDVDVLLSYMQYKNTKFFGGGNITLDWSSSIVKEDDEKSVLRFYQEKFNIINPTSVGEVLTQYVSTPPYSASYSSSTSGNTNTLISESIARFEFTDTWMQNVLDLNQDNRIDTNDLNIMWKYFVNRLTQANYSQYITPACSRKLFSDIIDHLNDITKKTAIPQIKSEFFDYERLIATDKTGSFLAPMVTTVGLYSGLDLVAVAKLGAPVKITSELPINFVVKMDF